MRIVSIGGYDNQKGVVHIKTYGVECPSCSFESLKRENPLNFETYISVAPQRYVSGFSFNTRPVTFWVDNSFAYISPEFQRHDQFLNIPHSGLERRILAGLQILLFHSPIFCAEFYNQSQFLRVTLKG